MGWLANLLPTNRGDSTPRTGNLAADINAIDTAIDNLSVAAPVGGVLASPVLLNPGTFTQSTATTTAWTAIDAVNLQITFTPPPSGQVTVRLSAVVSMGSGGQRGFWSVATSSGATVCIPGTLVYCSTGSGNDARQEAEIEVVGLTPGTPCTLWWLYAVGTGHTQTVKYGGGDTPSNNVFGAASMRVEAA